MGKSADIADLISEIRADREEGKKERAALDQSLQGIQVQLGKSFDSRLLSLEKALQFHSESTNKTIGALTQLVERLLEGQAPCHSIPVLKTALVSSMTNEEVIREKATRAVLIGIPEQENAEDTDQEDLRMVSALFRHTGDAHLLSISDKVTFHRHPLEKRVGSRDRPIKIQFQNQSDRDRFISCIRQTQACRQSGNVHSYVRRDLTMEEFEYDRSLRREAGKRNAEALQLEWVVRDLRIVRLSNPRPLPPRSQAALERVKASAPSVRESAPLPSCPPPSLHTLSPPPSPALCLLTVEGEEDPPGEEEARPPLIRLVPLLRDP